MLQFFTGSRVSRSHRAKSSARPHRLRQRLALLGAAALGTTLLVSAPAIVDADQGGVHVPPAFTATRIATGFSSPTALAESPDGRLFVSLQNGTVRIVEDDNLVPGSWGTIPVEQGATQGLFGLTFDPAFASNGHIYAFHILTVGSTLRARVSRFTSNGNNRVGGSTTIWQSPPLRPDTAVSHYGGDIHIGADDKLYFSFGDDLSGSRSQRLDSVFGKMLRLNLDGSIPTDNPFYTTTSGSNRAIYASGLRNPFKFTVDPLSGRMLLGDVGRDTYEELNDIVAGGNYGWNTYEGPSGGVSGFNEPFLSYLHDNPGGLEGCSSAGGSFYTPAVSQFPAEFAGQFFALDFCSNWVKTVDPVTAAVTDFADIDSPVDSVVAQDGSLYVLSRDSNDGGATAGGSLWKIEFSDPGAPRVTTQPESLTAVAGSSVTLDVVATGNAPLTYQWQRNGADIGGATSSSYTFNPTLADDEAEFRVSVSNSISSVLSNAAVLQVTAGGGVPSINFTSPTAGITWGGGDTIAYDATVTDPEDGVLAPTALTWTVNFHHDDHFHPFLPPTSGISGGSFVVPVDGETAPDVWFRILLDAEDSAGNVTSSFTDVFPRRSTLSLATSPPGLAITIDGEVVTGTTDILGVAGLAREISVLSPQQLNGTTYEWSGWSNGQGRTHQLAFPENNQTLTATFTVGSGGAVAPTIVSQPANATALTGETATFSVAATGDDPLTYQWQREGVDIPGATSPVYETPPLTPADDFSGYQALVTNPVGTIATRVALLRVGDGLPRVVDGLTGLWDFADGTGTIVSDTSGFDEPLDLVIANPANTSWTAEGSLTINSATSIASSGPATKLIEATGVSGEATIEAWITPSATNPAKSGRIAGITDGSSGTKRNIGLSQGWWNFNPTDTFDGRVRSTSNYNNAISGGSVTTGPTHVVFTAAAEGTVALYVNGELVKSQQNAGTFVWHDDLPFVVGNELNNRYPFLGDLHLVAMYDSTLSLDEVQQNFAAGAGVTPPEPTAPSISSDPSDQSAAVGGSATFAVVAAGDSPLTYQWRRNGGPIPGANSASLTLSNLQLAASGDLFDVVVSNPAGSATSASATLTVSDAPETESVLFVAGTSGPPNREMGLVTRLTNRGFDVTVIDDDVVTAADANGVDVVLIASSVVPTKVGNMFASSTTPVVTWEPYLHDDFGFAASAALVGESSASRRIDIADPTHPIAAGLSGSPIVLSAAHPMSRAVVGGDVTVIADLNGGSTRATVFAYEAGAVMAQGVAPARRVGLFPTYASSASLNASGLALFDAAVDWARDSSDIDPPDPTAPTFTQQPQAAISLDDGASGTLTAAASGNPTPSLQWRRNGVNIPGATSSTLALGPVTGADNGATFDVVATNSEGTATSVATTLTVVESNGITVTGDPTVTVVVGSSSLDVTWQPVAGASRYQIRYRPNGSYWRWDPPTTALARVYSGLDAGAHTVQVRSLIGPTWGPWTSVAVNVA